MSVCAEPGDHEVRSNPPRGDDNQDTDSWSSDGDTQKNSCTLFGVALNGTEAYKTMISNKEILGILQLEEDMSKAGCVFSSSLHTDMSSVGMEAMNIRKHYDGLVPSHGVIVAYTHEFSYDQTVYFKDDAALDHEVGKAWGREKICEIRRRQANLPQVNRLDFYTTCAEVGLKSAEHYHLQNELQEAALRVRHPHLLGIGHFGEIVFTLGSGTHSVKEVLSFILALRARAHKTVRWTHLDLHCFDGYVEHMGADVLRLVLADVRDLLGYGRLEALWKSVQPDRRQLIMNTLRSSNLVSLADRLQWT